MKLFYLAQRVPFPPDRGDKIRSFNEIRYLAGAHEVHVFCLADGADDLGNVAGLESHAASVTAVKRGDTASRFRALSALLRGRPFSVGYFCHDGLHRIVREARERLQPDAAIAYSSGMAQYLEPFADLPRIMDFVDLDSLKWKQYAERRRPPAAWLYATEARRLLDYERRIAHGFGESLVCTPDEEADFARLIPEARVTSVGNGVDLDFFRAGHAGKIPGRLVFTGVMDYPPNVDAVTWFAHQVLPRVREAIGNATFTICGSRPTAEVEALAALPGVTVTGRVDDVRPHLDAAEVAVVPIRIARGIQNKLLEAMAMRLPCVSTAAAWTGIDVNGESGVRLADDEETFAAHVIELLRQPALRERCARQAREAVERHYSWQAQLSRLDAVLARATSGTQRG